MRLGKMKRVLIVAAGIVLALLAGCASAAYRAEGADNYDKAYIVQTYHADLDSNLSLFPDTLQTEDENIRYEAELHTGLFDTDGQILLYCSYDPEQFDAEIARLQSLSITITGKAEQVTNAVRYDDESYYYPAYITIDGFGNTYEYALLDRGENAIVYLYLAYPDVKAFPDREYLKRDITAYADRNTKEAYSMYHHSFDGGRSWVEFDD